MNDALNQIKKIFYALLLLVLVFVVLNWQYFARNLSFMLHKPQPVVEQQKPNEKGEPNRLWVASIEVDVPVVYTEEKSEAVYQKALTQGVVHFPGTAYPGQAGGVYIFGHSSDFAWVKSDYKTAFALLPRVNVGDEIKITDGEGNLFRYEVYEKRVISPNDLTVLAQDPTQHILTLQTSYPIGTALKRYLVIAKLK